MWKSSGTQDQFDFHRGCFCRHETYTFSVRWNFRNPARWRADCSYWTRRSNGVALHFLVSLGNSAWEALIVGLCRSLRAVYLSQSSIISLDIVGKIFEAWGATRQHSRRSALGVGPERDFHFPTTWMGRVPSPAPRASFRIKPQLLTQNWVAEVITIQGHLRFRPRTGLKAVEIPPHSFLTVMVALKAANRSKQGFCLKTLYIFARKGGKRQSGKSKSYCRGVASRRRRSADAKMACG